MTKDNPKLTPEQRRKALYFQKWGLSEKNSTGDLRQDMRNWVAEADAEKKNKLSKVTPTKKLNQYQADDITKSRLLYEKLRGDFDHD